MSKKYRKFFKRAVSFMLSMVLCINMVFCSMASAESKTGSNEITTKYGTLEITSDSIIIDGHVYSKAQFTQALQQIKQLPEQQNYTQSNGQSRALPVLYFVGIGLKGVFEKIAFTLAMSGLLAYVVNKTYVLLTDTLPGLTRNFKIEIRDTSSVYFDETPVGPNWATLLVVQYLSENHASIEEVAGEEGDGEAAIVAGLGAIASQYGEGKCIEAAKAMAKMLDKEKKEYGFARLKMTPADFIASIMYPAKFVTDNGLHWGLIYNGNIYCNIHPTGLSKEAWKSDFYGRYPIIYEEFTTIQ